VETLPEAVSESMFRLTDLAVRTMAGFRKPLVFCESGFGKPLCKLLAGFSKPDMTANILSGSSAAYQKGFHIYKRLTKTWKKLSVSGFSKDLHNNVFIEEGLKCMFKYLRNYEKNKFKPISPPTESTVSN
jgi:hypothetical protein